MLPTIELVLTARLANPPETRADRNGKLVVVLHLLCDALGKRDGKPEAAWCRTTLFGELAESARTFRKGDQIFARGAPTLDRWHDRSGVEKSGLSMVASEAAQLDIVLRPPEAAYVPPSARPARDTADPPKKATEARKTASAKPRVAMEGGLPRGQKSWSAIRVKREETHWQAPPGWERAGGDRLDDIFK